VEGSEKFLAAASIRVIVLLLIPVDVSLGYSTAYHMTKNASSKLLIGWLYSEAQHSYSI
jgi:hypothetical protein